MWSIIFYGSREEGVTASYIREKIKGYTNDVLWALICAKTFHGQWVQITPNIQIKNGKE